MKPSIHSHLTAGSFRALGTEVEFSWAGGVDESLVRHLQATCTFFEEVFSRFSPTSELSRINAVGRASVSPMFGQVLELAIASSRETGGTYDPTILPDLLAAGYDDDFSAVSHREQSYRPRSAAAGRRQFLYHAPVRRLTLLGGTTIDLGGVAKGYLVDLLGEAIRAEHDNFWVGIGGDIVVQGPGESGSGWEVEAQHPGSLAQNIGRLALPNAGAWSIATSGVGQRQGTNASGHWHHLIDPRTRQPAKTDLDGVTVVSQATWRSDVLAKAAVILGSVEGFALLRRSAIAFAIGVKRDGQHLTLQLDDNVTFKPI